VDAAKREVLERQSYKIVAEREDGASSSVRRTASFIR